MIQAFQDSLKYFKLKALRMSLYSINITYILKIPNRKQHFMTENLFGFLNTKTYLRISTY